MVIVRNKYKYLFKRASRVFKGVVTSIYYSFFNTKRTKTIIFNSACNEEFTWNAKSLFLNGMDSFHKLGYKTYFVIDNERERLKLTKLYGDYFISTTNKKEKAIILNAAIWVLSTLETPSSGIFLNRHRFVYHLGHGTPIKNIGLMEKNVSFPKRFFYFLNKSNISVFLSTSSYFSEYMAKAFGVSEERIVVAPQPRIDDFLISKKYSYINKREGYKYILYAPTWRHYSETKLFPFPDFDIDSFSEQLNFHKVIILLRLHPRFEHESKPYLCENIISFDSSKCPDVSDALCEIDGLITDYSSIYCDYLILNKPVAFLPYDKDLYEKEIGFSTDYDAVTTDMKIKTTDDFFRFVLSFECFDFVKYQAKLSQKINFLPTNVSATEYNVRLIDKEYKKRWSI
ncbi:TPA: CDP-glycerol glycerophosphotransferase family protein [Escherichia albertii]